MTITNGTTPHTTTDAVASGTRATSRFAPLLPTSNRRSGWPVLLVLCILLLGQMTSAEPCEPRVKVPRTLTPSGTPTPAGPAPTAVRYGQSIAVTPTAVVVGSPDLDGSFVEGGGIHVFPRSGDTPFILEDGPDAQAYIGVGKRLAARDDLLVVGVPSLDRVYIYWDELGDSRYAYLTTLTDVANDGDGSFGDSPAVLTADGDLFLSAPRFDPTPEALIFGAGRVFHWQRTGPTGFTRGVVIIRELGEVYNNYFGTGLAAEGDLLAIGAPNADADGPIRHGEVELRGRGVGGANNWGYLGTIDPATSGELGFGAAEPSLAEFGYAVALQGQRLVVGAAGHAAGGTSGAGSVFVYARGADDATWTVESVVHGDLADGRLGQVLVPAGSDVMVAGQPGAQAVWLVDVPAGREKSRVTGGLDFGAAIAGGEVGWRTWLLAVGAPGDDAATTYDLPLRQCPLLWTAGVAAGVVVVVAGGAAAAVLVSGRRRHAVGGDDKEVEEN